MKRKLIKVKIKLVWQTKNSKYQDIDFCPRLIFLIVLSVKSTLKGLSEKIFSHFWEIFIGEKLRKYSGILSAQTKKAIQYEVFLFVIVHHILANIYYEFLDFRLRNTLPLPNHMSCTLGHGQNWLKDQAGMFFSTLTLSLPWTKN